MATQPLLGTVAKDALAFTIRIANTADAPAIRQIGSTVFTVEFGYSVSADDLNAYLEESYSVQSVIDDILNASKTVCVACSTHDQTVLGFAMLTEGTTEDCIRDVPSPVELQRLYVDIAAHGKGVGGAMVRYIEGIAREKDFETMWLGVWEENHRAQKVYQKLGYAKVGAHDFVTGKEVQTDEIWIKTL